MTTLLLLYHFFLRDTSLHFTIIITSNHKHRQVYEKQLKTSISHGEKWYRDACTNYHLPLVKFMSVVGKSNTVVIGPTSNYPW